ncbi:MAG TPA: tetratricopeptide repeat protein [Lacipirellulaceae bacterium]|nr:tetratricopeptide repeat protein [Lacipirellulaceae bacterium]
MRVARYFPLVVLASFIGQIAIPLTSPASDSAAFEVTDEPQPPDAQPQPERRFVDSAVQPAGFYDSRPRPNSTAVSPSESNSHHTGALFHGEFLHFPKLPFGRHTSYNEPTSATSAAAENLPRPSTPAEMRERELNQRATARMVQQRQWNGVSPQSTAIYGNNYQALHTTANLQPLPLRRSAAPQPMALPPRRVAVHPVTPASSTNKTISNGNMSSVSPWSMPKAAKPSTTPSRRPIAPPSPADRLLSQAHGLSTTAKTEPDYSRIVETCRRAEVSQPNLEAAKYAKSLTAWALNRRGQLKAEAGRDKEAILDFDDAIRTDASCWRAVHNRGVLLAQAGQFEKAFDDFNRTIQLNPQFAKAYSNRAALFMVANNLNSAHQDYKRAVELDPNLAVAHRGYGRVCQLLGRMDDAVAHYDAAVQLAPNDAYAAACRADLFTDIGRYSDALAEYNRALRIDPKSIQANCGSAWLLATCPDSALRNPQLAIERAEQAIELGGQRDAVSFDSLAAAQASAGEFDSAVQSIHKAIELAPLDERESYKERLVVYQQAKPFRIAPIERVAQQVSYETRSGQ